ncbi:uncharacterized protein LOC122400588 [Colletes gigas]|uniref:uncharacterized protein LOC122400588 n=1 Tax=Colletes gigas TaxID=935657 RepID=UPI001C9B0C22|nr:uncharacterized protein LOC122400588 [Colletes gigas]
MSQSEESSDIKQLRRQRANAKAQVKRTLSYLYDHEDMSISALEIRQFKLEQIFNTFSEVQTAIEVRDETSDSTVEWESFEQQYYRAAEVIGERLKHLCDNIQPVPTNRVVAESPSTVKPTSSLLRKIEIRPFDGNPIEWHSFHDTFKSLVHDNEELIGVQKFHLLKNALRGEASAIIESLNATEGNYLVAWDLLRKRCNKPRKIINAHLKLLFDLPEITRDTPSSLRQLAEQAQVHVNALQAVKQPTKYWDTILIHLVSNKLDKNTRRSWERTLEDEEIPRFQQLLDFINKHARGDDLGMEFSNPFKTQGIQDRLRSKTQVRGQSYVATDERKQVCVVCQGGHPIYMCTKFLQLSVRDRLNTVKRTKLCLNCLRPNHTVINCRLGNCRKCDKKHHTLLHFPTEPQGVRDNNEPLSTPSTSANTVKTALTVSYDSEILLGTAQITILDKYSKEHTCRVLLDSGSQTHFITQRLAELLQLEKGKIDLSFSGLGQLNTQAKYVVKTGIKSKTSPFRAQVKFIALPSITGRLPLRQIDISDLELPRHIQLADPAFHIPGEIDALIGNALFYDLLETGQIKLNKSSIILQNTQVGWIVTGEVDSKRRNNSHKANRFCHLATSLDTQINRFWEMEEIPQQNFLSAEERECEAHFVENTTRNEQGRYMVRLPFNDRRSLLGDSKAMALKRFYNLERKLQIQTELKTQYTEFLKEYSKLGHMTEVKDDNNLGYYLPHHAVIKESSSTTKVRVVFDASAKTSSGLSLNDTLLIGPTIQNTLFSILIRFRQHTFVLTADIEKMFRQIIVHPDDRDYQKIVWRDSINDAIRTFKLNTVTYGTTPAPFLATRSLKQLALDEAKSYPIASEIFLKDFYIDDLLTGADNFEAALEIKTQCLELAKAGGFHLRQWASNDTRLATEMQVNTQQASLCLDPTETRKTLGIYWTTIDDKISYIFKQRAAEQSRITKRVLLSQIAQLFDPLGLLGPVIIKAKIIMQQLWKSAIDWDDLVPQSIKQAWLEIKDELCLLNNFTVPRRIAIHETIDLELHGFSDASPLMCSEIQEAHLRVIKLVQLESFSKELRKLENGKSLSKKSRLSNLNPFMDDKGLIRVGSRLTHVQLRYNSKYPIVLPHKHHITELIIRQATHLELATDLTTESCLGALKRFLARRGKPRHIYSDNGTNFIGAKNEIIQAQAFLSSNEYKDKFRQFLTQENIEWHLSPLRSPHFGGLWEAAVKSFKRHLHKTIGDATFTYEQFYTLIVEIEAILNSRPLTPLSSDPNDFLALSPSHFLIGDSLACLPEHDLVDIQINKLSLWQHIQKIKQHFWKRWQVEYLQELHTRSKWHTGNNTGIKEGILVSIKDANSPPLQWQLGRVVAVHPGEDNVVRVVTVRTPHSTYKRALKNLAPLPIEPE